MSKTFRAAVEAMICCSKAGKTGRHDPGCWSGCKRAVLALLDESRSDGPLREALEALDEGDSAEPAARTKLWVVVEAARALVYGPPEPPEIFDSPRKAAAYADSLAGNLSPLRPATRPRLDDSAEVGASSSGDSRAEPGSPDSDRPRSRSG